MSRQVSLHDVARSVHELAGAVQGMRRGMVDRATVERIAADVVANGRTARRGYRPPENVDSDYLEVGLPNDPRDRLEAVIHRPARASAPQLHRAEEDVGHFQRTSDNLLLLATLMDVDPRETDYYNSEFRPAMYGALDSGTAGEGQEYVPRELSADLVERVALELLVANLFPFVVMPTNPFDVAALAVSRTRGGRHLEQTADTGQTGIKKITPPTRKVTLTAAKFAVEVLLSAELEEDSLVPILPFLREELIDYISADVEDAIVNGDTAGTHQDADVTAADDPRKNFEGLRKITLAAAKTDASNAALTVAMLRTNRKKMDKYGVRSDQLAHVISMANYLHLLGDANVMTLDKYGPSATVLAGELAKVDGAPVIVSEFVRSNLNATGVFDGTTTTRSVALTVNRRGFLVGERRNMTVQVLRELYAEYDQLGIVTTLRRAFSPRFPTATEKVVSLTYNLSTG
jgi:hypothetical protein